MTAKKITVTTSDGSKSDEYVANDAEFKNLTEEYSVHCLVTETGRIKVRGYESLEDGETYTLGPPRPQQQQQQCFFEVNGTLCRPSTHAGARHALFRFAADYSGIYPRGLDADTAFCARNCIRDEDRRLLDFRVVFRREEAAQQFLNNLATYVKATEGQVFFCDEDGAHSPETKPSWQRIHPYEDSDISPIWEANYIGRHRMDLPPRDEKTCEAIDYILKQKQDSETLRISQPGVERYSIAMKQIGVPKDAAEWNEKPNDLAHAPPHFKWHASKEDSPQNREAYMAYLRNTENLVLPRDTIIFDGNSDKEFLSVQMGRFHVKTSGNIDVPMAHKRHQSLFTVKENMLGAFELKKDSNKDHLQIERQVTLQHMAASYLNPNTGVLTVMTDLHERWHFFWFTKDKRLMRYESTGSEARFLIEHTLDEPESVSTPSGFLSRASWNDLFLASITESPEAADTNGSHKSGSKDDGDEGRDDDNEKEVSPGNLPEGASSRSRNETSRITTSNGGKRCFALDEEDAKSSFSYIDFMDQEDELEAVLHLAMHTSFHRMFGPPQSETGDFPPSEIDW